jgi:pyruvate/2-oxoglutarate dehydrogenase complex dihydrolipoamide acyltransferase (E2) component
MSLVEVKVPDIGDFKDVDVIEVNIKPGDVIENEQALMTLESDKASIEVPSDTAGTVREVRVKAGDKVSQGTVVALVETSHRRRRPRKLRKRPLRQKPSRRQPRLRLPLRPRRRRPRRKPAAIRAARISSATCSCSDPAPAATRQRSARPTSA